MFECRRFGVVHRCMCHRRPLPTSSLVLTLVVTGWMCLTGTDYRYLGYGVLIHDVDGGLVFGLRTLLAFSTSAGAVARDAHCVGFGVPTTSPLTEDIEQRLAVWAWSLRGLGRLRWSSVLVVCHCALLLLK